MAVVKHARRKGVGRALLRHIETTPPVEAARGPFFCYAIKEQELFYRECGWIVEEGHQVDAEAGIPHIAMLLRRRPRGSPHTNDALTLSHVMVRTWDISRARRFYSLLGFQDVTRFMTSGVKAVWIQSPYIDQKIELIEVKSLFKNKPEPKNSASLLPGLGHIAIDLSRACTDLSKFLLTVQKESIQRFQIKLGLLERPREMILGNIRTETAFMTDADGTIIELMRFIGRVDETAAPDAQW
ncbi:unnamed protein product [Chondrus crispus]|uniref:N-acetyltransferase domain-containing protein n=1 Tax=Chondrus crispus TaxID=2769 RepID=R7QH14_CHOCR|nr:unnamed protein product [Chondrus crispus]CDF36761.1 unnamed protein product [Chondrus crispus]|eukprot:XP_005716580.1 unnamed protein product [Chondrus crispus]